MAKSDFQYLYSMIVLLILRQGQVLNYEEKIYNPFFSQIIIYVRTVHIWEFERVKTIFLSTLSAVGCKVI